MAEPPLVWVDMEMTGLDPNTHDVLEIAVLLTDDRLDEIAVGPHLIVHQPERALAKMDEWCVEHHGASGLTAAVRASRVTLRQAEADVLAFLQAHTEARKSPLAGNSVHQDRRFIARHMQALDAYLHYRIVDVSTVKELAYRWYPDLPRFQKVETHRALDDIRASVAELRYYRECVFR
jgi:oligoribonuclease